MSVYGLHWRRWRRQGRRTKKNKLRQRNKKRNRIAEDRDNKCCVHLCIIRRWGMRARLVICHSFQAMRYNVCRARVGSEWWVRNVFVWRRYRLFNLVKHFSYLRRRRVDANTFSLRKLEPPQQRNEIGRCRRIMKCNWKENFFSTSSTAQRCQVADADVKTTKFHEISPKINALWQINLIGCDTWVESSE